MTQATFSYTAQYQHLNPQSDRVQEMATGYLWHNSHPDCYVAQSPLTGEFMTHQGAPTGQFLLQLNLFALSAPAYGQHFWLFPDDMGNYDANSYSADNPGVDGAVSVPWQHILQHVYDHFTDLAIKEAHTFWPAGTTEDDVLGYLVDALNNGGTTAIGGSATIAWSNATTIKTFFLNAPLSPTDKYSAGQMSDLVDLLT